MSREHEQPPVPLLDLLLTQHVRTLGWEWLPAPCAEGFPDPGADRHGAAGPVRRDTLKARQGDLLL